MKLEVLLEAIGTNSPNTPLPDIKGIEMNSKQVKSGDLFIAVEGFEADGHMFIDQAVEAGAVAVLGEQRIRNLNVPYIRVSDSRKALAELANCFYGYPHRKHTMIGITGTNGKTTTAFLLKHILEKMGKTCSLIGTVHNMVNNQRLNSKNTTPDSIELNRLLDISQDEIVIMEVSSHGIQQQRIEGIFFDYAIFTNLSHDHLDFHDNMWDYFQVKSRLFQHLKPNGQAIVVTDNEWGGRMQDFLIKESVPSHTVGRYPHDELQLKRICAEYHPIAQYQIEQVLHQVKIPLAGEHNIWNTLTAILTCHEMGYKQEKINNTLPSFKGVPGRFERYTHKRGAIFIVDYAHTADAIEYCLLTAKRQQANRIIHILGFRGNRDSSKRKEILQSSTSLSSIVILTLDDLNGISQNEMTNQLENLRSEFLDKEILIIPDRTKAIQYAWNYAEKGDWVFITGKGHEQYQQDFNLPCESDPFVIQYLQEVNDEN
ncbi:UDP-N-acetylmuramoyl-L-alanyl-D-glutamate--2,6-diaminopimelate ligase [Fictibacillus sp. NRS-1165]|uniref:UDP-N-acetylmuramoyl-L-alanyl-D-glutamate--2, 6-diaminopimelate ligase n=1 Tax=Fictibacillus sp. NRS-1165 TaxID=3144463 RepID=UPI003D20A68D